MPSKRFISDSYKDAETIGAFLEALKTGFEKGKLSLARGDDEIVFSPGGLIAFTVEGKSKGADRKIKISLRWKEGAEAEAREPELIVKA